MVTPKEAFQMAVNALRKEAYAEHIKPGKGMLVTRDMCPCGQTTGMGRTSKCEALRILYAMEREVDWDAEG